MQVGRNPQGGGDLANRLRLLMADLADAGPERRRECLTEEIRRVLKSVPPPEREAYLEWLVDQFPTWDARVEVTPPQQVSPRQSPMDLRELQDPSFLVSRLADLAAGLSRDQKQHLGDALAQAGFMVQGPAGLPEDALKEFRALVKDPSQTVDPARVLRLLGLLVEFACKLDALVWRIWTNVAAVRNIRIKMHRALPGVFSQYLAGAAEGAADEELAKLREATAALLAAIAPGAAHFASDHCNKYDPDNIRRAVYAQKGSLFLNPQARFWKKYEELAADMQPDTVAVEILGYIAASADENMNPRAHKP
jgi:hypothetical protein